MLILWLLVFDTPSRPWLRLETPVFIIIISCLLIYPMEQAGLWVAFTNAGYGCFLILPTCLVPC